MSAFSAVRAAESVAPPLRFVLPPSAFVDGPQRPTEPRDVGLRLLSEGDLQSIRIAAIQGTTARLKGISTDDPVWVESFNAALMLGAATRALCHPDDVHRDYWDMQRTVAPTALSPGGVERIWDELEALKIRSAPTAPEASAEDIAALASRLATPAFLERVPAGDRRVARRYLRYVLDMLEANDTDPVLPGP